MTDDYLELLEWLQQTSRTYGWGCLLAWDRDKVNSLLLQAYIDGFDSGHYLPPFTELIVTSTLTAEYIHGYTLDCPRLSFENATIRDPKARLRMQVVAGLQLSMEHVSGDLARVYQIAEVNALDGRSLYMNLALMHTPGATGSAGRVVLNLMKGVDFELTFASSQQERWLGGEYFRKQFELLDDDQKVFILGELGVPDELLKPADFLITTHGNVADPRKGAVLMLIRMDRDSHGHTPASDADLRYLLVGGYSFAILLSQDFLMHRLFTPACTGFGGYDSNFVAAIESPTEGTTHYLRAADGKLQTYLFSCSTAFFVQARLDSISLPLKSAGCSFELAFSGTDIHLNWHGTHHLSVFLQIHTGPRMTGEVRVQFEFKRYLRFELSKIDGQVSFRLMSSGKLDNCHFNLTSDGSIPGAVDRFRAEVSGLLEQDLIGRVEAAVTRFQDALVDIDLGKMTGLLFHRREDLVFEKFGFLRDLVLFGSIAPPLTSFTVRPVETLMGPAQTRLFTTWPLRLVTWSVANLPGQSGPVGSIDALGFYTAPSAAQLPGRFLRVKVTATLDGYSSSALVTVLPADITVNPRVMVHTAGRLDEGREMIAGSSSGGALRWALAQGHSGGRIVPSSAADGDHTYFPGPRKPDLTYSIDEVQVTDLVTLRVQTAYVLLLHQELVVVVTAQRSSDDTVQLRAFLEGDEHLEMPREWAVMLGGGSVDRQSGVFTPGASAHCFAIVTVQLDTGWNFALDGFILLPLPYVDLPAWSLAPEERPTPRG